MNMISTGAFLPETDASTKQNELVKKLTAAWEKKNSKTARAGGASLMALSLAACGGEDNTPFSAADVADAEAAATTAALTAADGVTVYDSVDAAVTAGEEAASADMVAEINTALGTSLTTADDAATVISTIQTSNDADVEAAATTAALTDANDVVHADVDAAIASDNTNVMMSQADYDAAIDAADDDEQATIDSMNTTITNAGFADVDALVAAYDALANPSGVNEALTTAQNIVRGTSSNDTFTADGTTLTSTDVITDGSTTDSDSLTVTLGEAVNGTAPTAISGIENVTYNITSVAAVTVDVDNIVGATITVNNTANGASTAANVDNLAATSTLVIGTGITGTADVTLAEGSDAAVNAGSAAQLDVADAGEEGASIVAGDDTDTIEVEGDGDTNTAGTANDAVTISAAGTVALDTNDAAGGATDQVENLTLSGNGAAVTFVLDAADAPEAVTVTGDQNVVFAVTDASQMDTETLTNTNTGTTTLRIDDDDADADYSNVASSVIVDVADTSDGGRTFTLANNGNAQVSAAGTVTFDSTELTTGDETINLTIAIDGTGSAITVSDFEVINVATTTPSGATPLGADSRLDVELVGGTTSVMTLTGSVALEIDTATVADSLNASAYTGAITMTTTAANLNEVTFGSGNDTITVATAETVTIDGGDGVDTLVAAADMDTTTFSNFEVLDATTAITNIDSSQLATAMTIKSGNVTVDNADTAVIDLSIHSVDANVAFTVTGTLDGAALTSGTALTITGNINNDDLTGTANDDTISGGEGADTITGGAGDDTYTGGAGADNFELSGGTDTITDFVQGTDIIQISVSALEAAASQIAGTTIDLVEIDDASDISGAEAGVVQEIADQASGAAVAATANSNIFVLLDETYANVGAMVDGIETGDHEITTDAAVAVDDGFIAVWSDGTNGYVSLVNVDNGGTADFAAGELVGLNLADLGAMSVIEAGDFVSADFAFVA